MTRVNGNLNLSRAIGDLKYKCNLELAASAQIITAEPDVCRVQLQDGDRFLLLACDGVWDVLTNQEARSPPSRMCPPCLVWGPAAPAAGSRASLPAGSRA